MWRIPFLVLGLAILAAYFAGNSKASPKRKLKSFRYNWYSGSKGVHNKVYEAVEDGSGFVKLLIRDVDDNGKVFTKTARLKRESFMCGLEKLTEKRKLDSWNCFKGYEEEKPPRNSFRLEASFTDGSVINAKSNTALDGYAPTVNEIRNYFMEQCK